MEKQRDRVLLVEDMEFERRQIKKGIQEEIVVIVDEADNYTQAKGLLDKYADRYFAVVSDRRITYNQPGQEGVQGDEGNGERIITESLKQGLETVNISMFDMKPPPISDLYRYAGKNANRVVDCLDDIMKKRQAV